MKVLYFCYLKSDPKLWPTLGDMRMAVEMSRALGNNYGIILAGDFRSFTADEAYELCSSYNAIDYLDLGEYCDSARYISNSAKSLKNIIDNYDLIHVHTSKLGVMSTIRRLYPNIPMVVSYHSPPETSEVGHFYKDDLLKFLNQSDFRFVCNSKSHKQRMINTLNVPVHTVTSLTYAYNAITDIYNVDNTTKIYNTGTIGRITSVKRMLDLVKYFKYLYERTGVQSYYVGDIGPYEKSPDAIKYYEDCKYYLESPAIDWIKFATPIEIGHIVKQAYTYTTFSQVETFGLTLLEAGLSGIPSVVFDVAGHGEIIDTGCNGYKLSIPDKKRYKISDLHGDFYQLDTMARELDPVKVREYTKNKFNMDKLYKDFDRIYKEVLNG